MPFLTKNISTKSLEAAIASRHPQATPTERVDIANKVINYMSEQIASGKQLAFVGRENEQVILQVLKLVENEG